MKRIDFSFHNSNPAFNVPAVQRTTFTAPLDIVGKTRLTRFKLSEGAFPLCQIPPSKAVFTTVEKYMIDEMSTYIPLDLYFAFLMTADSIEGKSRGSSYSIPYSSSEVPKALLFTAQNPFEPAKIYIQQFWVKADARWKKRDNGWILTNEPIFLYNFSDLYSQDRFWVTSNVPINVMNLDQEGNEVKFKLALQTKQTPPSPISTPYLVVSETLIDLFRKTKDDAFRLAVDPQCIGFPWEYQLLYPIPCDYNYNPQLTSLITTQGHLTADVNYDFSTSVSLPLPENKAHLFPYTAIVVIVDEFNNLGERLVINNPESTGVVNLSTLSITKLFIIGQTNYERSDFVFVNDSLQETPLEVNLPKQTTLTIRLFFLLKDNTLVPVDIPPDENFFAQFSIQQG